MRARATARIHFYLSDEEFWDCDLEYFLALLDVVQAANGGQKNDKPKGWISTGFRAEDAAPSTIEDFNRIMEEKRRKARAAGQ